MEEDRDFEMQDTESQVNESVNDENGAELDADATQDILKKVNSGLTRQKKEKPIRTKKEKLKLVGTWILSVLSAVIAIFSVTLAISGLVSAKKGYTSIAGYVYYTVLSGSMDGDPTLNDVRFAEGDVIYGKVLKDDQKSSLKVGDVITFWDSVPVENGAKSVKALNSHTIIQVISYPDGTVRYQTKGNNPVTNPDPDPVLRKAEDVVSIYVGKSEGFGKALIWLQSETGFIVCVLVPSFLIVIYCLVLVIINAVGYTKKKYAQSNEQLKEEVTDEVRAQMRAEIMKELGIVPSDDTSGNETDNKEN